MEIYLSQARGAKHEVVDSTQSMLSGPFSFMAASSPAKSVRTSSSSITLLITIGVRPKGSIENRASYKQAVKMHLRQVFWSTLGHNTY